VFTRVGRFRQIVSAAAVLALAVSLAACTAGLSASKFYSPTAVNVRVSTGLIAYAEPDTSSTVVATDKGLGGNGLTYNTPELVECTVDGFAQISVASLAGEGTTITPGGYEYMDIPTDDLDPIPAGVQTCSIPNGNQVLVKAATTTAVYSTSQVGSSNVIGTIQKGAKLTVQCQYEGFVRVDLEEVSVLGNGSGKYANGFLPNGNVTPTPTAAYGLAACTEPKK
jgi:hypothetical protein